jgi:hypothetical protein
MQLEETEDAAKAASRGMHLKSAQFEEQERKSRDLVHAVIVSGANNDIDLIISAMMFAVGGSGGCRKSCEQGDGYQVGPVPGSRIQSFTTEHTLFYSLGQ